MPRYNKKDSGNWIEDRGFVCRLLSDDAEGSPHQRFVIEIAGKQTLLIAHNIDLAERVPLGMGDRIRFRGMYEYNDLGGLVHWTHHDPLALLDGGYVRYRSRDYR
ncbi:MAG TPA: DUF3465 domain-containing protein [Woeseiaceae bacterium]|nr:DUF3465 domain-containing protein [Woeseiaceae bacterium]